MKCNSVSGGWDGNKNYDVGWFCDCVVIKLWFQHGEGNMGRIFLLSTSSCVCGCGDIVSNGERYLLCTHWNGAISCTMWNDTRWMTITAKWGWNKGEYVIGWVHSWKTIVCDWVREIVIFFLVVWDDETAVRGKMFWGRKGFGDLPSTTFFCRSRRYFALHSSYRIRTCRSRCVRVSHVTPLCEGVLIGFRPALRPFPKKCVCECVRD